MADGQRQAKDLQRVKTRRQQLEEELRELEAQVEQTVSRLVLQVEPVVPDVERGRGS